MIEDILFDGIELVLETEPLDMTATGDITGIGYDDYQSEGGSTGETNIIF